MKAFLVSLILTVVIICSAVAQNRPLHSEVLETVARGHVRLQVGFEFYQGAVFRLSGLEGDLSRIGVLGLRAGVGENAEIALSWTAQDFLNVDRRFSAPNSAILDFSGNSTSDVGDLQLATKVRLLPEKGSRPGVGSFFSVRLPNASNEQGLGNDEIDFFTALLIQKHISRLKIVTNLGLAILGDPVSASSQDDLFVYGVALIQPVNSRLNLVADLHGRSGPGGIGTEEQTRLRLGGQIRTGSVYWDLAAFIGFRDTDPDSGLLFGISKDFSF